MLHFDTICAMTKSNPIQYESNTFQLSTSVLNNDVIGCYLLVSERFGSDQVINTVLNINDSNTDGILNNFNVSKDEILRRISALQPDNDSAKPIFGERIFESETFASPTIEPVRNDAEKQE